MSVLSLSHRYILFALFKIMETKITYILINKKRYFYISLFKKKIIKHIRRNHVIPKIFLFNFLET